MNSATCSAAVLMMILGSQDELEWQDPREFVRQYRVAVSTTPVSEVHITDDSTALAIEFVRIRDLVREGRIGSHADYFFGFVGGRLRLSLPKWWADEIQGGTIRSDGSIRISTSKCPELRWKKSKQELVYAGVDEVEIHGEKLHLKQGQMTVTLRHRDFEGDFEGELGTSKDREGKESHEFVLSDGAVSATISDQEYAVAFGCPDQGLGGPIRIHYGDARTGQPRWNAILSEGILPGFYSGPYSGAYSEIRITDQHVIVFGSHGTGVSLQMFDKKTGKRVVLFVTDFLAEVQLKRE